MADIKNITIDGTTYDLKDDKARNDITDLKEDLTDITGNTQIPMVANKYVSLSSSSVPMEDGKPVYNGYSSYSCGMMQCSANDVFTVSGQGGGNPRLWGFVDSLGNILSVADSNASADRMVLTAPADSAWIIVHTNNGKLSYKGLILEDVVKAIDSTTIKNSEIDYYIGLNKFNKETVSIGKEVYGDGTLKTEADSAASDFIDVYGEEKIYLQNLPTYSSGMSGRYAGFYDENKALIGDVIGIGKAQFSFSCDIPSNAYYFRFSVYQRVTSGLPLDYSTVMVTFEEIESWFEPYTEYLKKIKDYHLPIPNNTLITKGLKAVIFGDSITETASMNDDGTNYVEGIRHNWPEYATDYLELGSFKNYAKTGASYQDNPDGSYRQSVSNQIALAVADSNNDDADIVIFSLGTNDSTSNMGSYSTAMSKATLNDLDRTVLYEALRYAFWKVHTKYKNAVCFAALPIQRMAYETPTALLTAITEMAHRYNFIIIDANAQSGIIRENNVVGGEGNDLVDGLHPNTTGQIKMARLYASVITEHYLWR